MKQLLIKGGHIAVEEFPDPVAGSGEVLVANAFSAVSVGTERAIILEAKRGKIQKMLKILRDEELRRKALEHISLRGLSRSYQVWKQASASSALGVPLGYSSAGIVVQLGSNVVDLNAGDAVACAGAGYANHAELIALPRNLVAKVPEGVDLLEASFATIGSIALHSLRLAVVQPGEYVAIIGVGLIGLIAVQLAKNVFNTNVIAIDVNEDRLKIAQKLGADKTFLLQSGNREKIKDCVQKFTSNVGVDVAIVAAATKSNVPTNLALEILRSRGKVVIIGDVGMSVNRDLMYRKEASIIVSRSYGPGRYDPAYEFKGIDYPIDYVRWTLNRNMLSFMEMLKNGKVQLKPLISNVVNLDEAPQVYEAIVEGKAPYIGVAISYDYQKYLNGQLKNKMYLARARTPEVAFTSHKVSGKIRLGIIGAGNFVNNVILPILIKELSSLYEIIAISTKHPNTCKDIAAKAKAKYCTTNYREILEDKDVDAVLVATPHSTHARIIMDALKSGKAIFVEKPITINEKELDEICEAYRHNPLPITVDFNRRFSPFMYLLKNFVSSDASIYGIYRVNAGFIPLSHWIQDPEVGGGRIIGEVCHFVDFFNAILRTPAEEIIVSTVPVDNKTVIARDNISATIKWHNGSLTTIHYTSIGSPLLPKEYVELYAEGKTITINDFTEMNMFERNKARTIKLPKQDKGHKRHLIEFTKLIKGEKSDIPPFEEYVNSMKLTFEIEKRLRKTANR